MWSLTCLQPSTGIKYTRVAVSYSHHGTSAPLLDPPNLMLEFWPTSAQPLHSSSWKPPFCSQSLLFKCGVFGFHVSVRTHGVSLGWHHVTKCAPGPHCWSGRGLFLGGWIVFPWVYAVIFLYPFASLWTLRLLVYLPWLLWIVLE